MFHLNFDTFKFKYNITILKEGGSKMRKDDFKKSMNLAIIGLFIGAGCITQNLINVGITVKAYPGEILDSFIIPGNNSPGGLTWDDPYLWIEDNKNLIYKVDSSSGGIFDVISTPISSYGGLAWDGEYLWNAGENDGKIYQIDPSDGTIKHSINSPGPDTNGLAFWGDYLWISDYYTRKIYLMRISNEEVIREFNGPGQYGLHGLAWDGEFLWCAKADPGEIFALTSYGVTIESFPSPSNSPRGLAWDGEFLWNADASTGRIYKINVTGVDNEVPITPQKPQGPSTGQIGKDLLFSVNTIDPDDDDIRYGWDWNGDDVVDEWSDYMSSGSTDTRPHSWMANGTYHIKVLAEDTFEMQSEWSLPLTIEIIKKSDLECNGNMVWNSIVPGDLITSSFTIQNIGDSGTELSWEIVSYPDWGNLRNHPYQEV